MTKAAKTNLAKYLSFRQVKDEIEVRFDNLAAFEAGEYRRPIAGCENFVAESIETNGGKFVIASSGEEFQDLESAQVEAVRLATLFL